MKKSIIVLIVITAFIGGSFSKKAISFFQKKPFIDWGDTLNNNMRSIQDSIQIDTSSIILLGTSITAEFRANDFFRNFPLINLGIHSNRTEHMLNRIPNIVGAKPRKIFTEGGINDIAEGVPLEKIVSNFEKIIEITKQYSPKTKVCVQSVFPVAGANAKYQPQVIELNRLLKKLAAAKNIPYIDVFSRLLKENGLNPIYTYDGIHLNYSGQKIWKEVLVPFI